MFLLPSSPLQFNRGMTMQFFDRLTAFDHMWRMRWEQLQMRVLSSEIILHSHRQEYITRFGNYVLYQSLTWGNMQDCMLVSTREDIKFNFL